MKNAKIYLTFFISFIVPFLLFVVIKYSYLSSIFFHSMILHSVLLIIISGLAFYTCRTAYISYKKKKDTRIFFIAFGFYIFGFFFFLHGVAVPDFYLFNEEIFDIMEHYGLFVSSFALLAIIMPWNSKKLYKIYTKILLGLIFFLLFGFILVVSFPIIANALFNAVNFFIILTGILFFVITIFLIIKYREKKNTLLVYFISAFSILINTGIIPLFYEEWNTMWWFFHIVFSLAFAIILIGLKNTTPKQGLETAFGEIPLYTKISTKIISLMIALSVIPLIVTAFFVFNSLKSNLENQIFEDITALSQAKKGQVQLYLDEISIRTIDFANDGYIQNSLENINISSLDSDSSILSQYLIRNKQPLDKNIYGILIIDKNGIVKAATDLEEIGKKELADDYYQNGLKGLNVSEFESSPLHFSTLKEKKLIVSIPILDINSNQIIGVLVNFFTMSRLEQILTGELHDNTVSAFKTQFEENTALYIINKEKKLLMSLPKDNQNPDINKTLINTPLVNNCLKSNIDSTGIYESFNKSVIGSASCIKNIGFIILVEKNHNSALAAIFNVEQKLIIIIITAIILVIIIGLFFSGRLTKPIELLTQTAEKIKSGDITKRSQINSNDEVGVLSRTFNQMADNLVQAREFPENIIRSMGEGMVVLDPGFKIIKINQAALELLEYDTNDVITKPIEFILEPSIKSIIDNKRFEELFARSFAKNIDINFYSKNKKLIPVSLSAAVMHDQNEKIIGIVFVAKDIRIYKEVDRAKSEFISIAAHQLRTPLSIIKWTFRMLLDKDFGQLNDDQVKTISNGNIVTANMIKLVTELLDVARLEEGRFVLKIEAVNVEKICQQIIDTFKSRLDEKKIDIKLVIKNIIPLIEADNNKIYLSLENLIDNAIKYSNNDSVINIEIQKIAGNVEIRIADSGIGITALEQNKIFTKFFRSKNATLKETSGSGLGLYIVKQIIEMHNGSITFNSTESKGSTFALRLPLKHININ